MITTKITRRPTFFHNQRLFSFYFKRDEVFRRTETAKTPALPCIVPLAPRLRRCFWPHRQPAWLKIFVRHKNSLKLEGLKSSFSTEYSKVKYIWRIWIWIHNDNQRRKSRSYFKMAARLREECTLGWWRKFGLFVSAQDIASTIPWPA